ncbi:MAG: tetratricopeptide repeat protein, partial [Myxococcales bacterium]|nr:tetratricopeptide repeat protein [Myxococcales bacterium]
RWDASCVLPPAERQEVQACLTRSADGLAALRELFAEGDPEVLAQGWSLVPELLDLQACRAHPTDAGREVEALRRATTARATLLATAGRLDAAREVLEELHAELLERGAARAVRLVEIDQAELLLIEGRYEDARAQLEALHFAAAAEGDAYGAGRSAVKLIAEAYRMSDVDQALHWARVARPLLERMQPRDADLEAVLEHNVALAHFAAGQLPEALARIRRAIERASAPGVEPSLLTGSQQVEAELLLHAGRPAEALAIHRTFLHGGDASAPRDVLATVVDLQSLGNALITLHELEDAHAAYLRSYELASSALGSEHPTTSAVCLSLARSEGDRGRVAEGQRLLASCLPELERRLGEEHPHVAVARAMGGRLASQAGEHERARTILRESLASLEQAFGEEHFVVADLWHELGVARAAAGDTAEARLALERALEFRRRDLPQGHVGTAESLAELARVELAAGAREQARVHLEEALEVFEQRQLAPAYVAQWRSQLDAMEAPP